MKKDNKFDRTTLDEYKIDVMHHIYRNIFLVMLVGSVVATLLSTWDYKNKMIIGIGYLFVFSVFLLLLYFVKNSSINIQTKYRYYVLFSITSYIIIVVSTPDKYLSTVAPMLTTIFLAVLFTAKIKYILFTGSVMVVSIVLTYLNNPTPIINLGRGYYFIFLVSVIFAVLLSIKAIQMINWYDQKLLNEMDNVFEKNIELTALNEEYYATQEELHHNYDEIVKLNQTETINNKKLDALLSVTEDGIIDYNITDDEYFFSPNAMKHLNITQSDNFETIFQNVSKNDQPAFKSAWQAIIKGNNQSLSLTVNYNQSEYFSFTFIRYESTNKSDYLIAAIRDITLLKAHENNIFKLAYTDTLTGLYNRVGFIEALDFFIGTENKPFAMALLDVDNFKHFNSIFGYDVGDKILKHIASQLTAFDFQYITRVGDDRFAFVISGKDITSYLEDLTGTHEVKIDDQLNLALKYSIGVCSSEKDILATELLKRAEIAMHEVKENGKSHFRFYDDSYTEQVERTLLLSNALEHALSQNEIFMNYQPIYDTITRKIVSFEALVRWQSEAFGFVPPNVFIKIAEQSGYIKKLSEFIMYESCLFAKRANEDGQQYIVSINVSGKQLLDINFADSFIEVLNITGVQPEYIGLEITETAVIENLELAVKELEQLHQYGITIYLDDFGTGYSSLNYLTQLPVDIIKIDKSFIDHIVDSEHDSQLVKSIIQLAKGLNLKTVAEGVESEEQVERLTLYGCDIIQGYYFDKPLKALQALERTKSAY